MYSSHRDACILSYYSFQLNCLLDDFYRKNNLDDCVIAYRTLGQANYDFSAEAYRFAVEHAPCAILAFDVTGFFDNLDHALLKQRLKLLLNTKSLSDDWYKVFKYITKFHFVRLEELKANAIFASVLCRSGSEPIATIAEIKAAGIQIYDNEKQTAGIPQGTPISASLSNLYMIDFDQKALKYCRSIGALYRRYSDDILIVCPQNKAKEVEAQILTFIDCEMLELSAHKTERTNFDSDSISQIGEKCAQYLGFSYYPGGAGIRPSSLSRQWRKMRRSFRRVRRTAEEAIDSGTADKVYTKKLRRRFTPLQFRNFSSYARRSAHVFGRGEKITSQIRRFEREVERNLKELQELDAD
jgi:hypothetical protein